MSGAWWYDTIGLEHAMEIADRMAARSGREVAVYAPEPPSEWYRVRFAAPALPLTRVYLASPATREEASR